MIHSSLRSSLRCTTCRRNVGDCTCPNQDARLRNLAYTPDSRVMLRWCRKCDKHFARCACPPPYDDYIICGGRELDPIEVRTLNGRPIDIDLMHR